MIQLTEKQKKIAWAVGALLILIHFAPRFLSVIHPASGHAAIAKPTAVHYAPVQPPPPPPPEVIAAGKYGGIWIGDALMPDQDRCSIRVEIRLNDDLPRKLKGYESKKCIPLQPLQGGRMVKGSIADVIRETSPVSAVMTGTPTESGINFTVDEIIGTPGDGCQLSGFTITDFGLGQVQAQWQEIKCAGGKMLLKKARG
jgi:hypothetical protein